MLRVRRFSWPKLAIALAIILPAIITLFLVLRFSVNTPFEDDWEFVPYLQAVHDHHLTLGQLWQQHNEHRIFFPRLLMLLLASFSHWNLRLETLISFLLAGFSVWLLAKLVRGSFSRERFYGFAGMIFVSWIFFSPVQWENWLWGWQIQWFLMMAAAVTCIWLAVKAVSGPVLRPPLLVGAAAAAIVASYSLGGGMFIWLAVLPILIGYKLERLWLAGWVALAVIAIGAYLVGYVSPPNDFPPNLILHQPYQFVRYFFTLIGRPLGNDPVSSSMWGLGLGFLFVLSIGYLASRGREFVLRAVPWISLGLFGLMICGLTSFSRFGAGVGGAMSSRYYAIEALFLIGALLTMLIALAEYRRNFKQVGLLGPLLGLGIFGMLIVNNYFYGIELSSVQNKTLSSAYNCEHTATEADHSCLKVTYPFPDVTWRRIQQLKSLHDGGF